MNKNEKDIEVRVEKERRNTEKKWSILNNSSTNSKKINIKRDQQRQKRQNMSDQHLSGGVNIISLLITTQPVKLLSVHIDFQRHLCDKKGEFILQFWPKYMTSAN